MTQFWITFRSLTHAQRAAGLLERRGATATVTRLPQGISAKGCGNAVVTRRRIGEVIGIIREAGIPYGSIFEKNAQGDFLEVKL